jgi:tRNA nucleotidyltransferase/poly(A) polymerase
VIWEDLDPPQRNIVEEARLTSRELGIEAWLVGGCVRDLLLGRPVEDIDLVVEERTESFAARLAGRIEAEVRSSPRFGTFKLTLPDAEVAPVDVVTARSEKYLLPGALPEVSAGLIDEDLFRRDFTVNALAVSITSGEIRDTLGSLADLRARLLRVMHEQSFIDDPTRIFRAIRLGTRLGFALETETGRLLREALAGAAVRTVSPQRLWREIVIAFAERDAPPVIAALAEAGALAEFLGREALDDATKSSLQRAADLLRFAPRADRDVVYLAVLGIAPELLARRGSLMSHRQLETLARSEAQHASLARRLESRDTTAAFLACGRATVETLIVAGAASEGAKQTALAWLESEPSETPLRKLVPPESGRHFRKILRQLRAGLASGVVSRDEAPLFARNRAFKYLRSTKPKSGR